jgi:hypothetical protein
MERIDVIQQFIDKHKYQQYLEIGVNYGYCFMPVKIPTKYAVDPSFRIPLEKKIKWNILYPRNIFNKYFECGSDEFFAKPEIRGTRFDIAFIDGLHTFRQSLQDVLNAYRHLNAGGVIVMHDCNPPDEASSVVLESLELVRKNSENDTTGVWCGDVWKTIVYLRHFVPDNEIFVLDTDFGIGVIKPSTSTQLPEAIDEDLFQQTAKLTYHQLAQDRSAMTNLKPLAYFYEFLSQ